MVGDVDVFYVYMGVNVVNLSRNESDGYILNLGGFIVFMNGVYNLIGMLLFMKIIIFL